MKPITIKSFLSTQYILLATCLVMGQLQRIQLTPNLALYVHDLLIVLILLTWLMSRHNRSPHTTSFIWWPLSFTCIAILSLIFNYRLTLAHPTGVLYLARYSTLALLLPITYDLIASKILQLNLPQLLNRACIAIAILGIIQYIFLPDTRFLYQYGWDDHLNRLISTPLDPAFTGIFLIFGIINQENKKQSRLPLISLLLITISLTYSRASYLTAVIIMILIGLRKFSLKRFLFRPLLLLFLILLLPRTAGEGVNLERTYSITSRLQTTTSAVDQSTRHPLLGIGFNNYRHLSTSTSTLPSHSGGPDNSFALLLVTSGFIGFCLYLFWILQAMLWAYRHSFLLLFTLLAIIIHSFFNETLFYPFVLIYFWLLFAYKLANHHISKTHHCQF